MRRRDLLGTVGAAGVTALAGCTFGQSGLVDTRLDPEFEPRRRRRTRPIVVAWDDDAREVVVQGFMYYGSSSCNRIGVTESRYDAGTDTLHATFDSVEKGGFPNLGCTADMAASHYRARFRFADALPETVVVREQGAGEGTAERTVVRSEQERLCTTDHPEGSDAAERAHWTCPEKYLRAAVSEGTDSDG